MRRGVLVEVTRRMSSLHALCRSCEWPVAKVLLDDNGLCGSCVRTARTNGVSDEQIRRLQRLDARCV